MRGFPRCQILLRGRGVEGGEKMKIRGVSTLRGRRGLNRFSSNFICFSVEGVSSIGLFA